MSHLCTVFFPFEKIKEDSEDNIEVVTSANGNEFSVYARVYDKSLIKTYKLKVGDDAQTQMSVLLFNVLCEITGFKPPWEFFSVFALQSLCTGMLKNWVKKGQEIIL